MSHGYENLNPSSQIAAQVGEIRTTTNSINDNQSRFRKKETAFQNLLQYFAIKRSLTVIDSSFISNPFCSYYVIDYPVEI